MNVLRPAPVSTRQFTYHAANRTFVGEISSTHGFGRVYDDACDEGLTLVSARTGVEITFVVDHTIRDEDGVRGWVLRPTTGPLDISVLLFND